MNQPMTQPMSADPTITKNSLTRKVWKTKSIGTFAEFAMAKITTTRIRTPLTP